MGRPQRRPVSALLRWQPNSRCARGDQLQPKQSERASEGTMPLEGHHRCGIRTSGVSETTSGCPTGQWSMISRVEEETYLVRRACKDQVRGAGCESHCVDLSSMTLNLLARFTRVLGSRIPAEVSLGLGHSRTASIVCHRQPKQTMNLVPDASQRPEGQFSSRRCTHPNVRRMSSVLSQWLEYGFVFVV